MGSKERGLPCFTVQVYLPSSPSLTNTFLWQLDSRDSYNPLFYCCQALFFAHQSLSNALYWHKLLFRIKG